MKYSYARLHQSRPLSVARLAYAAAGLILAIAASLPAKALARAGGGSSGFHSSGGSFHSSGGGFHSSGSGFHSDFGGSSTHVSGAVVGAIFGGIIAIILLVIVSIVVVRAIRRRAAHPRHGLAARHQRVVAAAAEAAEDDAAFSADNVHRATQRLFFDIQRAWSNDDREKLARLVGPELLAEWTRRLDDFKAKRWRNIVKPDGPPQNIWYVGLANRGDDAEDRVVVRIEATLSDYVSTPNGRMVSDGASSERSEMDEYWTLGKRNGHWTLLSIEQPEEGAHHLRDQIVATPWSDDERIHEQAVVEGAVADKAADGYKIAELASLDFEGDARSQALDLSLADARFAPDVLETEARRAVAAWAEAIDSDRSDLHAVATDAAARALLHPGDPGEKTRLVVRGPNVRTVRLVGLDAQAEPPTMTIELDVSGCRYIEDRDTAAVVSGSKTRERRFKERWTLTLDGSDEHPWRIASTGDGSAVGAAPAGR